MDTDIHAIPQRFRGASLVLLMLADPFLQPVLFVGCLGILGVDGI